MSRDGNQPILQLRFLALRLGKLLAIVAQFSLRIFQAQLRLSMFGLQLSQLLLSHSQLRLELSAYGFGMFHLLARVAEQFGT